PSALVRWNDTRVAGAAREPLGRHRIAFKDKSAVSLCVALGSAQERSHEAGAPQVPGDEMAGNAPHPGGAVHRLQAARSGKAGILRAGRHSTPPDGHALAVRDEPWLGARAHPTALLRLPLRGLKGANVTMAQAPPHAPAVRISPVRPEELLEIGPAPCRSGMDVGALLLQSTSARRNDTSRR